MGGGLPGVWEADYLECGRRVATERDALEPCGSVLDDVQNARVGRGGRLTLKGAKVIRGLSLAVHQRHGLDGG